VPWACGAIGAMARRGDRRRDRGKVKRRGAPHRADLGHEDRGI